MKKFIPIILGLVVLASSCTIEKRHYRNGFYVSRNNDNEPVAITHQPKVNSSNHESAKPYLNSESHEMTGSVSESAVIEVQSETILPNVVQSFHNDFSGETCEVIIMRSGNEIKADIVEINPEQIKYKKCDDLTGPVIVLNKNEVFMIKNTDGTNTVINQQQNSDPIFGDLEGSGGGKSQLVALLLCLFFGYLGIHRFYLGYFGIGIIQLLTAGGCGIWALIDLILIITGDLKPKNGDYGTKF